MSKCRSTSFCDLRFKDVINICDGRRLGRVIDIVIDISSGKIRGIVVPGDRSFNIFRRCEDLFVPWRNILRIGEDVILVEMIPLGNSNASSCQVSQGNNRKNNSRHNDFMSVSASVDISENIDESENAGGKVEDLKPKVLKYLTASSTDE